MQGVGVLERSFFYDEKLQYLGQCVRGEWYPHNNQNLGVGMRGGDPLIGAKRAD